jgi:beta-lactamase regulating signal transducer with metallopeptidase domain
MALFLLYIIKSSICLTLFYLFFVLAMRDSTFFRFNRTTLLIGTVVCMLLPLFPVTISQGQLVQVPMQVLSEVLVGESASPSALFTDMPTAGKETLIKEASPTSEWGLTSILGSVYIIGMVITLGLILSSLFRMWQVIRNAPRRKENGYWLIVIPHSIHSFSFGKYIVLSEEDYQNNSIVLVHEQMHLRYRHTQDSLWFMLITILHWFNPVVWLMRLEMQQLHEFEADEGVIKQGIDATQYQLLLVKKAVGTRLYSMANGFNHSKLKKRITMMLKERTNGWARLKLLIAVPIVMGTMLVFARPEVKETLDKMVPVTEQENNQPQDLIAMKEFFNREMEKNKMALQEIKSGVIHSFLINKNNQILYDRKKAVKQDEILKVIVESFLNSAADHKGKTGKDLVQSLGITYDIHANEYVVCKYLCEIKRALEKLPELAPQMELDGSKEKWPILVFFDDPKSFSKEADSKRYAGIEVKLYNEDTEVIGIKDFTENELKDKLTKLKHDQNDIMTVQLKFSPNAQTEEINRVKELLRMLYVPQKIELDEKVAAK